MKRVITIIIVSIVCVGMLSRSEPEGGNALAARGPSSNGWDIYFTRTYGNEVFLTKIFPTLPGGFPLAIDQVLATPREVRFDQYGVLNDPDCKDGTAETDFLDDCPDPNASGVIGIRKYPNPDWPADGPKYLFGSACAFCHAGLDAENPPEDPNHPKWNNIDVMPGNHFLRLDKVFGGHLSEHDPRWQVFNSWAPGTVDTTAVWNDHINATLAIRGITDLEDWHTFDVDINGEPSHTVRQEHSGQDDVGCELRSIRVWLSEGMCPECSLAASLEGRPINLDDCTVSCEAIERAKAEAGEMCHFLHGWHAPSLKSAPAGSTYIDGSQVGRGRAVFEANCASCHDSDTRVFSDGQLHTVEEIGVNKCAALTTNWSWGAIWQDFSSDTFKDRPLGQVRTGHLDGVWATAPLLHNNKLGPVNADPSVGGRVKAFEAAMDLLLNPEKRDLPGSILRTTTHVFLPSGVMLPAGFPIYLFANSDGMGGLTCDDAVEIKGHRYGEDLPKTDKAALIEYLKTL